MQNPKSAADGGPMGAQVGSSSGELQSLKAKMRERGERERERERVRACWLRSEFIFLIMLQCGFCPKKIEQISVLTSQAGCKLVKC